MKSAKVVAAVAFAFLMVADLPIAAPVAPEKSANLKSGRFSLPSSLFEKPFVFAGENVPLQRHDVHYRIMCHVNFLLLDARSVLTEWLAEKSSYSWIFHEAFVREGMPKEFSLLAPILVGLNVKSSGRPAGIGWWYLAKPCTTAEGVDMVEDSWRDDRLDPELSTRCFAARLKEIRRALGGDSWLMAVAAYLTSPKTIQDLQERWNTKVFWDLPLPEIPEEIIVRWIALTIIDTNRAAFGLNFQDPAPVVFDQVTGLILAKDLPVAEVARITRVPPREIVKLNPKLKPSAAAFPARVQGAVLNHTIAVPKGAGQKLLDLLKKDGYLAQSSK